MLAGILMGFILNYRERSREKLIYKTLAVLCVVGTGLVLVYAVLSGVYFRLTL